MDKKDVEKIWCMTPSQYAEYKLTWDPKTYKNITDWEHTHQPVVFDPSEVGIKASRGRSPSPPPSSSNPSPPTASERPNLYSRSKKQAVPTTPTAKFKMTDGDRRITINFSVENPSTPGLFTHGTVKLAKKALISELKREIQHLIDRGDFFLMFMGYRLASGDMVGERLRDGNKVLVIGSWNTKDPQPAKPKAKQPDREYNLSISAPERRTTLQYTVTDSTLGSSVQEQVANALNLKEYEPILTSRKNPIALNKTLKEQGFDATTKLQLSTVTNLLVHILYNVSNQPQKLSFPIAFNKTGYELRARVAKRLPMLKGTDFQLLNSIADRIPDDRMLKTIIDDDAQLVISLNGQTDFNIEQDLESDEDEMDIDSIADKDIRVHFKGPSGDTLKADFQFEYKGKTVQDLYDAVKEYFLAEDNETTGKPFIIKYNFHHMRLTDKLEDVITDTKHIVFDVEWGKDFTSASKEAIVIS